LRELGDQDSAVVREVSLDASPVEVWSALTEPDRLSAWLGGRVEIEVRPGGRGTVTREDGVSRRLVVEAVEPGRRLAFRWWPFEEPGGGLPGPGSRVELTLEPRSDRTILTVREWTPLPASEPARGLQAVAR